ncbi:hypothetical protein TELCIR_05153 [Teladorsagia circumcincta]|uniref:Uncharacterized protein n=1 Tax=Teladorsagia circumcincta TaxID=45464 RepID=A0A2G9URK0_TELCI|nr:hypothetical protein TELCIR_05153 [Teladorsagia circumcincta]
MKTGTVSLGVRAKLKELLADLMTGNGYWQFPLEEEAKEKTAFTTPDGLFQFKVTPFGLSISRAVRFQHQAINRGQIKQHTPWFGVTLVHFERTPKLDRERMLGCCKAQGVPLVYKINGGVQTSRCARGLLSVLNMKSKYVLALKPLGADT